MDNAAKLLELAKQKFGTLSKAEERLYISAAKGEIANFSLAEFDLNHPINHPFTSDTWDASRVIKAHHIVRMCTNPEMESLVSHKGLQIIGARIEGSFDLSFSKIRYPLLFKRCRIMEPMNLQNADIFGLNMSGSYIASIIANGIRIERGLFLRDDFAAFGPVILKMAYIGGNLDCQRASFGYRLSVNQEGDTKAIDADGIIVKGSVFFINAVEVDGEARFVGGNIDSQFICREAKFHNPKGYALNLDCITVGGALHLSKDFVAEGQVSVALANIGANLELEGGRFDNQNNFAINADFITVKNNVFIRDGFSAHGILNFTGAKIGGAFVFSNIDKSSFYELRLKFAQCIALKDDKQCWPQKGLLDLHGFAYVDIDSDIPINVDERLIWLRLQRHDKFIPQNYEQLAKVYRKDGKEEDAKKILIAKNEDEIKLANMPKWSRCRKRLLGWTIGFGYRPFRVLWWVMSFIVLGSILFGIGFKSGVVTAAHSETIVNGEFFNQEGPRIHKFNALMYSIDNFIPLIDFHATEDLLPDGNTGKLLYDFGWWEFRTGSLLCFYMYVHIFFGWLLTSLLVVGLTGLLRQ